jgi:hypothetical protein
MGFISDLALHWSQSNSSFFTHQNITIMRREKIQTETARVKSLLKMGWKWTSKSDDPQKQKCLNDCDDDDR